MPRIQEKKLQRYPASNEMCSWIGAASKKCLQNCLKDLSCGQSAICHNKLDLDMSFGFSSLSFGGFELICELQAFLTHPTANRRRLNRVPERWCAGQFETQSRIKR